MNRAAARRSPGCGRCRASKRGRSPSRGQSARRCARSRETPPGRPPRPRGASRRSCRQANTRPPHGGRRRPRTHRGPGRRQAASAPHRRAVRPSSELTDLGYAAFVPADQSSPQRISPAPRACTRRSPAPCSSSGARSASSMPPRSARRARSRTRWGSPSTAGSTPCTSSSGALGLLAAGFAARAYSLAAAILFGAMAIWGFATRERRRAPRPLPGRRGPEPPARGARGPRPRCLVRRAPEARGQAEEGAAAAHPEARHRQETRREDGRNEKARREAPRGAEARGGEGEKRRRLNPRAKTARDRTNPATTPPPATTSLEHDESAGRNAAGDPRDHRPDPVPRLAQGRELGLLELVDPG